MSTEWKAPETTDKEVTAKPKPEGRKEPLFRVDLYLKSLEGDRAAKAKELLAGSQRLSKKELALKLGQTEEETAWELWRAYHNALDSVSEEMTPTVSLDKDQFVRIIGSFAEMGREGVKKIWTEMSQGATTITNKEMAERGGWRLDEITASIDVDLRAHHGAPTDSTDKPTELPPAGAGEIFLG